MIKPNFIFIVNIVLLIAFPVLLFIMCVRSVKKGDEKWTKEKELSNWKSNIGRKVPIFFKPGKSETNVSCLLMYFCGFFITCTVDAILSIINVEYRINDMGIVIAIVMGLTTLTVAITTIIYSIESKKEYLLYTVRELHGESYIGLWIQMVVTSLLFVCILVLILSRDVSLLKGNEKEISSLLFIFLQECVVVNIITNAILIWIMTEWVLSEKDMELLKKISSTLRWRNYEINSIGNREKWTPEVTNTKINYLMNDYIESVNRINWTKCDEIRFGNAFENEKTQMRIAYIKLFFLQLSVCVLTIFLMCVQIKDYIDSSVSNVLVYIIIIGVVFLGWTILYLAFWGIVKSEAKNSDYAKATILRLAGSDVWGFWYKAGNNKYRFCRFQPLSKRNKKKRFWVSRNNLIAFFLIYIDVVSSKQSFKDVKIGLTNIIERFGNEVKKADCININHNNLIF